MKQKRNNRRHHLRVSIMSCLIMAIAYLVLPLSMSVSHAASATIELKNLASSGVKVGDTFSVSLTITSGVGLGQFETYIAYDQNVLEFVQGGSNIRGSSGNLYLADEEMEGQKSKKYVMEFKAIAAASSTTVSVEGLNGDPLVYDYANGAGVSVSKKNVNFAVSTAQVQQNKSDNNQLSSLTVSQGTLFPAFSSEIVSYQLDVAAGVSSIKVTGTPADSKAKVSVSGADKLYEGQNCVTITVVAENGQSRMYDIIVNRATEEGKPSETAKPEEDTDTTPKVEEQSGYTQIIYNDQIMMLQGGFTYQLIDINDASLIPAGYDNTTVMIDSVSVPAYVQQNANTEDYVLLYLQNGTEEPRFYQYCVIDGSLQVYQSDSSLAELDQIQKEFEARESSYKMKILLLSLGCGILAVALVTMIIIMLRNKRTR